MCDRHSSCVRGQHNTRGGQCDHPHGDQRDTDGRAREGSGEWSGLLTRRTVLAGGTAVAASLAGCLGSDGDEDVLEPLSLTRDDECEVCGMIIPNHPGPTAQVFYAEQTPSGHANPARFCSTWEAFQYDFERQNEGWNREVFYVTDYSSVDYELTTDAGDTLISTHVESDDYVDATTVTFVAGSEVKGAMGRDLIGFSEQGDAEQFQSEYGGTVVAFEDVTEQTIAELSSI
ncbi:nitrous oxide reductase accessory protein NosL [Salinibaculum rarum]|uniref:nitrous oxide reductase accessory protein NosL n=1 Tax=Salinibaculum rarum TaxID=3058903 RepID=UPI00265F6065|nr:nitrous oxide reductase accessory protein NosL [Salinibaculum sp. KK48]